MTYLLCTLTLLHTSGHRLLEEDLLHAILLLDQEVAEDSLADALVAAGTAVRAGHCSVTLGHAKVLLAAFFRNTREPDAAVSAGWAIGDLLQPVHSQAVSWSPEFPLLVVSGVEALFGAVVHTCTATLNTLADSHGENFKSLAKEGSNNKKSRP